MLSYIGQGISRLSGVPYMYNNNCVLMCTSVPSLIPQAYIKSDIKCVLAMMKIRSDIYWKMRQIFAVIFALQENCPENDYKVLTI